MFNVLCRGSGGGEVTLCAEFHSRAFQIALETDSSGDIFLSSKISLFLAVHKLQQTHGNISDKIPRGGRQTELLQCFNASENAVMSVKLSGSKCGENREDAHTFLA